MKEYLPTSMYVLSVRVLFFFRWGKYSLTATCHIWVSTGTACGLFKDIKQTQSATLAPTPGKETNPVKATKNYLNHNWFLINSTQIFSKPLKNSCSHLLLGQFLATSHFQQIANAMVKEKHLHGMVTGLLKCFPFFFFFF